MANNDYYDQLMVNCLKVNSFNKKESLKLFVDQFPEQRSWMRSYAHKVYERVVENMEEQPSVKKMVNEMVNHLRVAQERTLQRGIDVGDWGPFGMVIEKSMKMAGVDKGATLNIGQHVHMSKAPEEVSRRIEEIESAIARRVSGSAGGVPAIAAGATIVDIQASQQTTTG